jgi:hypothetical protein
MKHKEYTDGQTLLRTPFGPQLYGIETLFPEYDFYEVFWNSDKSKRDIEYVQTIAEDTPGKTINTIRIPFSRFIEQLYEEVPQAMEAYLSRQKEINELKWLKVVPGQHTIDSYTKMIHLFSKDDPSDGLSVKLIFSARRQALRFALYLRDLIRCNKFNPTLSECKVKSIEKVLSNDLYKSNKKFYEALNKFAGYDVMREKGGE